jgi:hypothetical protein
MPKGDGDTNTSNKGAVNHLQVIQVQVQVRVNGQGSSVLASLDGFPRRSCINSSINDGVHDEK